jgi:hypothetical protein
MSVFPSKDIEFETKVKGDFKWYGSEIAIWNQIIYCKFNPTKIGKNNKKKFLSNAPTKLLKGVNET